MTVQWITGAHHGLVWPHGLAVVSADVPTDAAVQVWSRFAEGGDLAAFLKELSTRTGADLLFLPDFAIALRTASGWQLAARGDLEARAGDVVVRGAGITTWAERRLESEGPVVVGVADPTGDERPLVAGVVPAAQVTWAEQVETPVPVERVEVPTPVQRVELPTPVERAETGSRQARPAEEPETGSRQDRPAEEEPRPVEEARPTEAELETRVPEIAAAVPEPEREASEPEAEPEAPAGRFARMYGETRLWSVEDAAVRQTPDEPAPMIAVPSFAPPTSPAAGPDIDAVGDHDGATMLASGLTPPPPDPLQPGDPDVGPTVLAVECVHGHPNPPQRSLCSECGGAIVGEPRRVPRPSLGTLVLPGGERIDLTAPVILGRRPRAERVQGPVLPRLVPLAQGHVSGSHLEIRLEEWNVLAVDLHSTNGTFLRRQGESPVRLGEPPVLLVQGDVLDLGHGVQVRLEFLR